jgi:hypothetical protein
MTAWLALVDHLSSRGDLTRSVTAALFVATRTYGISGGIDRKDVARLVVQEGLRVSREAPELIDIQRYSESRKIRDFNKAFVI